MKNKRKRKIPEIEEKVWARYPFHVDEKTCADLRERRNGLRDMYRNRLLKEKENEQHKD